MSKPTAGGRIVREMLGMIRFSSCVIRTLIGTASSENILIPSTLPHASERGRQSFPAVFGAEISIFFCRFGSRTAGSEGYVHVSSPHHFPWLNKVCRSGPVVQSSESRRGEQLFFPSTLSCPKRVSQTSSYRIPLFADLE